MPETLLTVDQAATRLQMHPDTLRRQLRQGRIKSLRAGKLWRIPESALTAPELQTPALSKTPELQTPRQSRAEAIQRARGMLPNLSSAELLADRRQEAQREAEKETAL